MKTTTADIKRIIYKDIEFLREEGITVSLEVQKGIGATLYQVIDGKGSFATKRLSPYNLKIREMDIYIKGLIDGVTLQKQKGK